MLALLLLTNPVHSSENENIQSIFTMGMLALQNQNFLKAAEIFGYVYERSGSNRALLEKARALFLAGQMEQSEGAFIKVYNDERTPQQVKRSIDPYLSSMKSRSFDVSGSLGLISDSNPMNFTYNKKVNALGTTLSVIKPSDNRLVQGLRGTVSATFPLNFIGNDQLDMIFTGDEYSASFFDKRSVDFSYKRSFLDNMYADFAIGYRKHWSNMSADYNLPYANLYYRPDGNPDYMYSYFVGYQNYLKNTVYDARIQKLNVSRTLMTSTVMPVELELGISSVDRVDDYNSNLSYLIGLSSFLVFSSINALPSFIYQSTNYRDVDPFFNEQRKDKNLRAGLELSKLKKKYGEATPSFGLFFEKNRSNISYFEYNKVFFELNFRY